MKRTSKDLFDSYNFRLHGCPFVFQESCLFFLLKGQLLGISRNPLFLGDLEKKISGIVGYFRANCIA